MKLRVSKFETRLCRPGTSRGGGGGAAAFSIVEVLVVMVLLILLVIAAVGAVTLLERISSRQAQHTTAVELAQGKLDAILAQPYNPPLAPFTATNRIQREVVTLTVGRSGTARTTAATVTTLVQPVVNGHVATVVVQYTNYSQPSSVQLQTLINRHSGGQQ